MAPRYRTVAAQAVGVALLAAIVFVAFLRPSEPANLSDIDAGGDANSAAAIPGYVPFSPPGAPGRRGNGKQGQGRPGTSGGPDGRGGPSSPGEGPGSAPGGSPPTTGGGAGGGSSSFGDGSGVDDPTGSQYGDVVARLLAEIEATDSAIRIAPRR